VFPITVTPSVAWCDGDRVRLYTRGDFDWVERYPAAASAVGSLKVQSCCIDEVVVCDEAGGLLSKFCHATRGTNWRD
jgi:ATP-dependent DNA ligase